MDEVWVLEYLNALLLYPGFFRTATEAFAWAEKNDQARAHWYIPRKLPRNIRLEPRVVLEPGLANMFRNQR